MWRCIRHGVVSKPTWMLWHGIERPFCLWCFNEGRSCLPLAKIPTGRSTKKVITKEAEEFAVAMDKFKIRTGIKFPEWTDAFKVLMELGYRKF